MKNILALCGSQRAKSANLDLIKVVQELSKDNLTIELFSGLDELPHFNPDLDQDEPPQNIALFRQRMREADGLLISTPEYAMGVPGTLKNALDWLVSSMDLSKKPMALITASTSGKKAHQALIDTLQILEARMNEHTRVLISFIKTKINSDGELTDEHTRKQLESLIDALMNLCEENLRMAEN